jgi:nucleoside 2-deoxyribosyltransferase
VINEGDAPYAPHLYLTDVLDDNKPEERENGIACGLEFLKQCDEILAYAPNNSLEKDVTPGMFRELSFAVGLGIPRRKYMKPIELKFPYKIAGYWLAKREAEKSC